MKTIKMTVGEALIRFLDKQYVSFDGKESKFVEGVFALFGHGCVLGAGEALSMSAHGLKVYQGKNEQGMAHVAIAYAKQKNRRGILPCFSSIGPGAANMVTAAGTATANHIPLLLFPGDTFATRQPDPVLQQIELPHSQTLTTNDAFRAVTRYFDRVSRPEMLMSAMLAAMRVLTDPADTGAVCIALPQDVQAECFEFPASFFEKRVHRIGRRIPEPFVIESAAKLLSKAKKPLVIAGGGVRYSEAGAALEAFCARHNIPFCETQAGKSAARSSHALNLGGVGVTGNAAANRFAEAADLILAVGTKCSDFTTASKSLFAGARVIGINPSKLDGVKLDALHIDADAKAALEALSVALGDWKSGYRDEIEDAKAQWSMEYRRLVSTTAEGYEPEVSARMPDAISGFQAVSGSKLTQTAAIGIIRQTIEPDAVIVGASGSLPGCLQRMWETDAKDTYNMEYGYSCMGYEIAGALGSKLAAPQQSVYAMVGDGSYLMLHSEMVTAVQEGVKIGILLFDNGGFGCINNLQMGKGVDSLATEFRRREGDLPLRGGAFLPIDFAMSARAYGFAAYTAKTEKELCEALRQGIAENKPFLIDIKVLPKSMTDGYGGWWNVGLNEMPRNTAQKKALQEKQEKLIDARKF